MQLLHIDSSALGDGSATRALTAAIVAGWQDRTPGLQVAYRDLDAEPVVHLGGRTLSGGDEAADEDAARILRQVEAADVLVIGAPMYNFGIPSALKAWIDRIAIAGKTFRYTAEGAVGLLAGKRAVIAVGSGGLHGGKPTDFVEPYLRTVLGFIGITDLEVVRAEGLGLSPDHRERAMSGALAAIPGVVRSSQARMLDAAA
jgi:FMN-dependent NADH-azoreductase